MARWLVVLSLVAGCHQLFGLDEVRSRNDALLADTPPGQCGHRDVAAGREHTCAIDVAGAVWCWGSNSSGQVQVNGPAHVPSPLKIDALPQAAVQVAAGRTVSCARLIDGSVWCWGANGDGELGNGQQSESMPPTPVSLGSERAIDIDVGAFHACIRRESDAALMCWGNNGMSELGVSGAGTVTTPTLVPDSAGMLAFDAGHRHNCAIAADGTVRCWGKGGSGQLGGPPAVTGPPTTANGVMNATAVAAGGRQSCAVTGDVVRCWGDNTYGQLGSGTYTSQGAPGAVVLSNAVEVGLGTGGACALRSSGGVECWGLMIPGNGVWSVAPLPRPSSITTATQLAVGFWHACAIADGEVQCWGEDRHGELGRGTRGLVVTPSEVALGGAISHVGVDQAHACAVSTAGDVHCWGENEFGQLADGTHESDFEPNMVPTGVTGIVGIAAAHGRACVWNGTVARCWGRNEGASLGTGSTARESTTPVTANVSPVKTMALGDRHTCAVTTADSLKCWGHNGTGQLGFTSAGDVTTPTTVAVGAVAQAGAGFNHTCARKLDNTVSCWGQNDKGQIGNNGTADTFTPVNVLSGAQDLSVGYRFACAIASSLLYCWGENDYGELGLGDTTVRRVPTVVPLPGDVAPVDVEVGGHTACVRAADSKTYCWGDNRRGQLANANAGERQLVPLESTALAAIDEIGVSSGGGCSVRGGALACWGATALLGNGDVSKAEPRATLLPCP